MSNSPSGNRLERSNSECSFFLGGELPCRSSSPRSKTFNSKHTLLRREKVGVGRAVGNAEEADDGDGNRDQAFHEEDGSPGCSNAFDWTQGDQSGGEESSEPSCERGSRNEDADAEDEFLHEWDVRVSRWLGSLGDG